MTDDLNALSDAAEAVMYDFGQTVAHSSDECGVPDVGLSLGLGGGKMLYVGDVPNCDDCGLTLYATTEGETIRAGGGIHFDEAKDILGHIEQSMRSAIEAARAEERRKCVAAIDAADVQQHYDNGGRIHFDDLQEFFADIILDMDEAAIRAGGEHD